MTPRKPISEASKKTIQRRASAVETLRNNISSTNNSVEETMLLHTNELRRLGQDQRAKIIKDIGICLEVPPEQGLAMKTELGLPWNLIRNLRR